jgi:hypothetical protein
MFEKSTSETQDDKTTTQGILFWNGLASPMGEMIDGPLPPSEVNTKLDWTALTMNVAFYYHSDFKSMAKLTNRTAQWAGFERVKIEFKAK